MLTSYAARVVLVFSFLLSACASQPTPPDFLSKAQTVGVVSALGDTFTYQSFGLLAFNDQTTSADISDWKLDELVASTLTQKLGPARVAAAMSLASEKIRYDYSPITGLDSLAATQLQHALAGTSTQADIWIVVWRVSDENLQFGKSRWKSGIGAQKVNNVWHGPYAGTYIHAQVTYVDGRTFKAVGGHRLLRGVGGQGGGEWPFIEIFKWPNVDRWEDVDLASRQRLREATTDLLQRSLDFSFGKMQPLG